MHNTHAHMHISNSNSMCKVVIWENITELNATRESRCWYYFDYFIMTLLRDLGGVCVRFQRVPGRAAAGLVRPDRRDHTHSPAYTYIFQYIYLIQPRRAAMPVDRILCGIRFAYNT